MSGQRTGGNRTAQHSGHIKPPIEVRACFVRSDPYLLRGVRDIHVVATAAPEIENRGREIRITAGDILNVCLSWLPGGQERWLVARKIAVDVSPLVLTNNSDAAIPN